MSTVAVLAQYLADDFDGHHGWGDGSMWLWGTLMMLIVVGLVASAIWALARRDREVRRVDGTPRLAARARETLDERYARGEIDSDEYRDKVRHLEESD